MTRRHNSPRRKNPLLQADRNIVLAKGKISPEMETVIDELLGVKPTEEGILNLSEHVSNLLHFSVGVSQRG